MKKNNVDKTLKSLLHYFFIEYLPHQRGLSKNTISSYKETFKLFMPWIIKATSKKDVSVDDITIMLLFDFLSYLEKERGNTIQTRNARLAALKTFFKMCYFLHPNNKKVFEAVSFIQSKKAHKPLIDYFGHDDVLQILKTIRRHTSTGDRDYVLLCLLYDTGMRASEIANLKLSNYDSKEGTLELIGKGNKWRKINIWPRTRHLINKHIEKRRITPKHLYRDYLFVNQKGEPLTRSGIYKICRKYLNKAAGIKKPFTNSKRSPVHSWRHTAAVYMVKQGYSLLEIKVRLGHSSTDSTLKYLNLDLTVKRERVKEFIDYISKSVDESLTPPDWSNDKEVVEYLKSL